MSRRYLRALSDRLGIISEYTNMTGRRVRASDETREALLSVMGFDAPNEDAARGWLEELDHQERETILSPVRVVERDDRAARQVRVQLPSGVARADVELTLTEEAGHVWKVRRKIGRSAVLPLPTRVPYGYHTVELDIHNAPNGAPSHADQSFIVVPSSCVTPKMVIDRRRMGIVANLYSVRRESDWGVGDMCTFMHLVEWAASRGAAFVGVNPLHALFNHGIDISPYSPVSRLFRNPIYIDVESVPEWSHSETARAMPESKTLRKTLQELRGSKLVDYEHVIVL